MSARHGHSRNGVESPTYVSWHNMTNRCKPGYKQAANYIERGIAVCDRWRSFPNFLADMGERPPGTTLDRIDNDRGYEPGNCRWATLSEQRRNRTDTRALTFAGRTMCVTDWAAHLGIKESSLRCRLDRYGWTVERALSVGRTK